MLLCQIPNSLVNTVHPIWSPCLPSDKNHEDTQNYYVWVANSMTEKPPIDEGHAKVIGSNRTPDTLRPQMLAKGEMQERMLGMMPISRTSLPARALLCWFAPKVQACDDVFATFILISVQNLGPTISSLQSTNNQADEDLPLVSTSVTCGCSSP